MSFRERQSTPNSIFDRKEGVPNYDIYGEFLKREITLSRAQEYLSIKNGELYLWGISLRQLAEEYNTPLEIVCKPTMELRANQITTMIDRAKQKTQYRGGSKIFYALKANPSAPYLLTMAEILHALETSSSTDVYNILRCIEKGDIQADEISIVTNGYKALTSEKRKPGKVHIDGLVIDPGSEPSPRPDNSYLTLINKLAARGVDITDIIDSENELKYLRNTSKEMKIRQVGLRLKVYGVAKNMDDLIRLTSRHGLDYTTLKEKAKEISSLKHLELTTFHAMISAAGAPPMDDFIGSLLLCANLYFDLKKDNPSLSKFNIGGGVPAIGFSDFNHQEFFEKLFKGIGDLAKAKSMDAPEIQFEMGTPIAREAGMVIYEVIDHKINSIDKYNNPVLWCIINGSTMEDFPDMKVVDDYSFPFWGINGLNARYVKCRIGGETCDGDDCVPGKGRDEEYLILPDINGKQYIIGLTAGAYQETLTGFGGVGHCGLNEPDRVVIYEKNGVLRLSKFSQQTPEEIHHLLGF